MLRIINVQIRRTPYVWNSRRNRYVKALVPVPPILHLKDVIWSDDIVGDVVDVEKQKKLCSIQFKGDLCFEIYRRLTHNLDITELTTITGKFEQFLRERYDK